MWRELPHSSCYLLTKRACKAGDRNLNNHICRNSCNYNIVLRLDQMIKLTKLQDNTNSLIPFQDTDAYYFNSNSFYSIFAKFISIYVYIILQLGSADIYIIRMQIKLIYYNIFPIYISFILLCIYLRLYFSYSYENQSKRLDQRTDYITMHREWYHL